MADMTDIRDITVAGIAGGVGATVTARLLNGLDAGREVSEADLIVARNDYRCAMALVAAELPAAAVVLVLIEEGRALTVEDFRNLIPNRIVGIKCDPAVARADDAGLLVESLGRRFQKFSDQVLANLNVSDKVGA